MLSINPCNLCPRECGIDRYMRSGYCQCSNRIKVARAALHHWEEPCLSGYRGSGTVFFSGCILGCCYCQNYLISQEGFGKEISVDELAQIFLDLQNQGAHNINLVTAAQYLPGVIKALGLVRNRLHIPIIYNSGGYERVEAIQALDGYVDIYLPDIKYFSNDLAWKYSRARDYFQVASAAVQEMVAQIGGPEFTDHDIMQKGVIIRHLVMPGGRKDSIAILRWISDNLPRDKFILSLMSQYTPVYKTNEHKEINRRITTFEYESVVEEAVRLGLSNGYMQERASADQEYIPPFDLQDL